MKLSLLTATAVLALALSTACTVEPVGGASSSVALTKLESACLAPRTHDCSFYVACLEAAKPCGSEGYAVGYGDKYCNRFLANDSLSPRGAVWRDETMLCLQTRLGRYLGDAGATCGGVLDGAFADHPSCYTQPQASICDLPATDWISIVRTIDEADLLSGRGRRQIAATASTCLQRWVGLPGGRMAKAGANRLASRLTDDVDLEDRRAVVEALSRDPEIGFADLDDLLRIRSASPLSTLRDANASTGPRDAR